MKFLTPIYSTLMHAFKDHAFEAFDSHKHYHRIALMQEYGTLRIDGGRQTGKTAATVQFSIDWLKEDNSICFIGFNGDSAKDFKSRMQTAIAGKAMLYNDPNPVTYDRVKDKIDVFPSVREFLSHRTVDRFRGRSFKRMLIIIDEPCNRMPEMYKFYDTYENSIAPSSFTNGKNLPLFFVLGIQ